MTSLCLYQLWRLCCKSEFRDYAPIFTITFACFTFSNRFSLKDQLESSVLRFLVKFDFPKTVSDRTIRQKIEATKNLIEREFHLVPKAFVLIYKIRSLLSCM